MRTQGANGSVSYWVGCLTFCLAMLLSVSSIAWSKERIRYYINDPAGSPARVVDGDGVVVAQYRHAPFGEQLATKAPSNNKAQVGFVGGVHEANDLEYLKHRYYNPVLGRFYQPDPVPALAGGVKQISRYAYGLNDPYLYCDADGRELVAILDTAADAASVVWDTGSATYFLAKGIYYDIKNDELATLQAYDNFEKKTGDAAISAGSFFVPYANAWILKAVKNGGIAKGVGARFADEAKLLDHFKRHGADFGAKTASAYAKQADNFLTGPLGKGVLQKTRANGDIVRFNPATDEFGVLSSKGPIRTYYKPDPAVHGKASNLDYFNAQ